VILTFPQFFLPIFTVFFLFEILIFIFFASFSRARNSASHPENTPATPQKKRIWVARGS